MKILLFLCLLFTFSSFGQRFSFVEYSTAQGLPQSQVTSIAQDDDGYLWVGTLGGLAKFNGKKFISYTRDNGLAYNKVTFLKKIDHHLWIGHEGGVSVRKSGVFAHWYLPKQSKNIRVTGFVKYQKNILIATNGDGLYKIENNKLIRVPFPESEDDKLRDILEFNHVFYLATREGVYQTSDFKNYHLIQKSKNLSISDLEMRNNQLIVTTFNDGIFEFNPRSKSFKLLSYVDKNLFPDGAYTDHVNNLWVNTSEGLLKINPNHKTELINDAKGLPLVQIECVFEDNENNLWLGSNGKGLLFFPGEQFVYYNQNTGLPTDLILNINQDQNNQFWISTFNKGVVLQKQKEYRTLYDNIKTIWSSAMNVNGLNWFGTELGLISFKGERFKAIYTKENGLPNDKITALFKLSNSKMFIGGKGGLVLYDRGTFSILHNNDNQYDIGTIRDLEIYNNKLYVGTDKGLYTLNKGKIKSVLNFSNTIFCLANQENKALWIGSEEGLFVFRQGKIENRNFATETASRFVNFLNYHNQKLYIGTNNGLYISKMDKNGKQIGIEHFGIQEGVVNLETNINSGYIDKSGNLWFGTAEGLVQYRNPAEKKNVYHPRLILQNILINYQKIQNAKEQEKLSMASSKNNISFEFDGISLSNPEEIFYQFWLEGAEESWSPVTSNPYATFTGLKSGEYRLHARAVGDENLFSKELIIPFNIRPPFYFTWWFILIGSLFIGLLIYLFFKFRIRSEREKNEKETMVFKNKLMALEQQSLNASMNRHFIFNSLNSIQYFINTQDKISANKFLSNFAKLIRKNLDASSSEGNFIPLSKELERLELYLSLESMRFKDRFTYEIENSEENTADQIMIPAMLLQPFVENSIVHGILPNKNKVGEILVSIWKEDNLLSIKIEDNGIGISQSLETKNAYNGDHKSQGMEITAKRITLIKEMSNKGFEIIGPQDRLDENRLINGTMVLLKIPLDVLDNSE